MIGTAKRLISEERLRNAVCPHCNAHNSLNAKVFAKIFVLKILPFNSGKAVEAECVECKKYYANVWQLPAPIRDKAIEAMKDAKPPIWGYIGYALIGLIMIIALFSDHKARG